MLNDVKELKEVNALTSEIAKTNVMGNIDRNTLKEAILTVKGYKQGQAAVQILCKILNEGKLDIVKKNGLLKEHFLEWGTEYDFIIDHYERYGNVPDIITVKGKYEYFPDLQVNESEDFLVTQLRAEYMQSRFAMVLPKARELAIVNTPAAYEYLVQELPNLKVQEHCTGTDIIAQAQERFDIYEAKLKSTAPTVISTGLPELDSVINGWEYGEELVTIVARTNQGKSWILLKFLTEAWKQGKRVGLYSGEMSAVKLGFRFDALHQHISNMALVRGHQVDQYDVYCKQLAQANIPFIIITQKDLGGRPTVQKLKHFVEENNIEILGIDQYSLMEDGRASQRDPIRLRLGHIAEDLFLLSTEYKIPVLGLAQANRESTKKDDAMAAPGLENIKESDDIAHNSSKVIGMMQWNNGLILDITKNREGAVGNKLFYNWNIDTGHFAYFPINGDAATGEAKQVAVQKQTEQYNKMEAYAPF